MKFKWFLIRRAFWIRFLKLIFGDSYSEEILYTRLLKKRMIASNEGYILFSDSTWFMKHEFFERNPSLCEHVEMQRHLGIYTETDIVPLSAIYLNCHRIEPA